MVNFFNFFRMLNRKIYSNPEFIFLQLPLIKLMPICLLIMHYLVIFYLFVFNLKNIFKSFSIFFFHTANNWRLRTSLLLSHGVWTEASQIDISLCLSVRPGHELELCKPVKVMFAPKPVKRAVA